jgi:NADH-quinone oxidoreductase subunit F
VDLHLIPGAIATPDEREAVDRTIASHPAPGTRHPGTSHYVPQSYQPALRHLLLPALHAVQARIGWISEGALNYLCEQLSIPPSEAFGVASFYAMLSLAPRPPRVVHVCDDIACRVNGAEAICSELEHRLGKAGKPVVNGTAMWLRAPCLGQCDRAPAALFQLAGAEPADWTLTHASAEMIAQAVTQPGRIEPDEKDIWLDPESGPSPGQAAVFADAPRLLRRIGVVDPTSLDDYRAHGGYTALRRAVALGPDQVIREVTDSRLVGRGGALFPAGRKWDAVAKAVLRPHYLVCNADESEPGTFKDRVVMEEDPFALIESMTIAAFATGCEYGYVYVRGEYPLAARRLHGAIEQARVRGLLGDDILGEGIRFDVELRRGAGAYICGEETALFNSIEGLRGEPRNKPPFPVQSGLFGKPTVINNVETLVNVLDIVLDGGQAYAETGTAGSSGTKLFCLSGCVTRPGLYEVPFGITLKELIARAGGVRSGRPLRAVLLGGAAGVFVTPDELDLPLTVEGTRAAGATLGSGVIMLFDDRIDMRDITTRIAAFFRDESCGQCVPCRVGTIRQEEALHRLSSGQSNASFHTELALIDDVAQVMRDASICGLGQTAASAVQSAIKKLKVFALETA